MDEYFAALEEAFRLYREELEAASKKQKPLGGFLGFGHSLKDDACHERFDERVKNAVDGLAGLNPPAEEAERAVRMLLRDHGKEWKESAQWMFRAAERHSIPLIPFLTKEAAGQLYQEYNDRYKRWERLPAQKKVYQELKKQAGR